MRAAKSRAITVFSSVGSRPFQEDYTLVNRERGLFAVADGFGGPGVGSQASQCACESIVEFLQREAGDDEATFPFINRSYYSLAGNVIFNALVFANRKLLQQNKKKSINEKGGASVIAGYLDGNLLALGNIGACSAWMLREGRSTQLVTPRTYSRQLHPEQLDPISEYQAPLAALGLAEDLEPEVFEYSIRPGDWILTYTDGVFSRLREEIFSLAQERLSPETVAQQAANLLECQSYADNSSLILTIF